jgi:hypothetical protein
MANTWTHDSLGSRPPRRLRHRAIKACPVCGALNAKINRECFVCSWSGRFDEDADSIERGLYDLMDRCPEIAEILFETEDRRPRFVERLRGFIARFRRRVDVTV